MMMVLPCTVAASGKEEKSFLDAAYTSWVDRRCGSTHLWISLSALGNAMGTDGLRSLSRRENDACVPGQDRVYRYTGILGHSNRSRRHRLRPTLGCTHTP